jgi:hypothetical protein
MVVSNKAHDFPQELHLTNDSLPYHRVLPDDMGLLIRQFSGFSQDPVVDHDFPYIVEQCGQFQYSQGR